MQKTRYEVTQPLLHNGKSYAPGDTLTLYPREAQFLLADGRLKPAAKKTAKKGA